MRCSTDYAATAREAAQVALQAADRYQVMHNLADALTLPLARCHVGTAERTRSACQKMYMQDKRRDDQDHYQGFVSFTA